MGLWSKMKGVFSRIGSGLKYFLKPALTVAKHAAVPVGAVVGSIIPGLGTSAGLAAGSGASIIADKINRLL